MKKEEIRKAAARLQKTGNRTLSLAVEAEVEALEAEHAALRACEKELRHLVVLLGPLEKDGRLDVPGLATLNGARAAIAKVKP